MARSEILRRLQQDSLFVAPHVVTRPSSKSFSFLSLNFKPRRLSLTAERSNTVYARLKCSVWSSLRAGAPFPLQHGLLGSLAVFHLEALYENSQG